MLSAGGGVLSITGSDIITPPPLDSTTHPSADGGHPTGMLSCLREIQCMSDNFGVEKYVRSNLTHYKLDPMQ